MFNKKPINYRFKVVLLVTIMAFFSCIEDVPIIFSEEEIKSVKGADISILYPEVEGNSETATRINNTIEDHIVNAISFSEEELKGVHLADAVGAFNKEYERFKLDFPDSEQQWTASVEGEVIYQSEEIITIAMNSYLDTGGAHGNDSITFLNFNTETGESLENEDFLKISDSFNKLVKKHFEEEVSADNRSTNDYFFGEPFQLPANIGLSEDGVVFLYNVYEIASYANGYTEFVIPFEDIDAYLKMQ